MKELKIKNFRLIKEATFKFSPGINMFNEVDALKNNEGLRVVYVAITRSRKLLRIAVPEKDLLKWRKHFDLSDQKSLDFF